MDDVLHGPIPQLLVVIVFAFLIWRLLRAPHPRPSLRSVAILVLGDIGRSPRMMYHAESFAKIEFETYMIGYRGSKPAQSLLSLPHVHFLYLSQPPASLRALPFLLLAPLKIAQQILAILVTLLVRIPHPPEFILVQNPPSIPTLALVYLVGRLRGSKVIIDWHNLGYSILALRLGQNHVLVKLAKWFEATFGRSAYAHLFVTRAMKDHLMRTWNLQGTPAVLHDRPPAHFRAASPSETHELLLRLAPALPPAPFLPPCAPPHETPLTRAAHTPAGLAMPVLREDRPAVVVSSTSWTADEDFELLLRALAAYEARARVVNHDAREGDVRLPKVLMLVTGKGPLRERYMTEVQHLQDGADGGNPWEWVRCVSLWLAAEDYPVLLGSADVGVSLHTSSSALDLPMKVVDMFGCGLPVCALDFACLPELVKDGTNGLVFSTAEQLAAQLESLLTGYPHNARLGALRAALAPPPRAHAADPQHASVGDGEAAPWASWDENWARVVRPLVLADVRADRDRWSM